MANPWEKYSGQQESAIVATPLPRNPYEVDKDNRNEARNDREEGYNRRDREFDNAAKFRSEFRGLPSVVEYNVALGTFNSSMKTQANAQGDQSLITSYAKMLDPTSAVREGEFATTASTQRFVDQIKARFAKELGNGGMLTEGGRQAIREEMRNLVVNRFQAPYERDRQQYSRYAQMEGLDPYLIVGEDAKSSFPSDLLDPPKVEENLTVAGGGQKVDKLPQEYQDAHYAYLRQNWGKLDPEDYTAFRTSLDQRYKQEPNPDAYRAFTAGANKVASEGGSPADLGAVPSPNADMGYLESALNTAAQSPEGAFLANMGNAGTGGLIVELTGNRDRLEDIRDINPGASFAGELAGGVTGTWMGGKALAGLTGAYPKVASILSNPTIANAAYGGVYGATQDRENRFRGGVLGAGASVAGDQLGRAIGGQFPGTFNRSGLRAADEAVPSVDELQEQAGNLYRQAEANGVTAQPDDVNDMIGRAAAILRREGGLSPRDRITAGADVSRGMNMLNDFADTPMTPTQAGSVRKLLGEGRTAMKDGAPDFNQRRIAGQMLDEFDAWAEPALPGVDEARKVAQRAILGREMATANELATGPRAAQFTQSGEENALRSVYRGLDTKEVMGRNSYPPELESKIQEVARGTNFSNAMRALGKFAPTSAVSSLPTIGAAGVGSSAFGPLGLAMAPVVAGAGLFGRKVATGQTQRAAREAELVARGGEAYSAAIDDVIKAARERAALWGAGLTGPAGSMATRGDY